MNELLKRLLEAEILTAETKAELETAFTAQMEALISETQADTRKSTEDAVRMELAQQWVDTRDALVEAIDHKVTDLLSEEVNELKADIASFRDLEVEYAAKLTEAQDKMAAQAKADIAQLVEEMDSFLEQQIVSEFEELKADIKLAQENVFGRQVFESFVDTFRAKFVDESEVAKQLEEANQMLASVTAKLNETTANKLKMERTLKLEGLLAPLQGNPRQLMETILSSVDTQDLDKAYAKFIGRVVKEGSEVKEDKVLAEGTIANAKAKAVVKTGDMVTESAKPEAAESALSAGEKLRLQRMAGLID